jgi:hypothetical protein
MLHSKGEDPKFCGGRYESVPKPRTACRDRGRRNVIERERMGTGGVLYIFGLAWGWEATVAGGFSACGR